MLEVWLINLERSGSALDALETECPRLDAETVARLAKLANAKTHRARRRAHVALRQLLAHHAGSDTNQVPYLTSGTGRPSLGQGRVDFSLSHTEGRALIAVTDSGQVGVDIEPRERTVQLPQSRRAEILATGRELRRQPLQDDTISAAERDDEAFLLSWVCIEAYAKALGIGVGRVLENIRRRPSTSRNEGAPSQRMPADNIALDPSVTVLDVNVGRHHLAAIAHSDIVVRPEVIEFPHTLVDIKRRFSGA